MKKYSTCIALFTLCFAVLLSGPLVAQNQQQQQQDEEDSGYSFEAGIQDLDALGGQYIIDQMGIAVAQMSYPYDSEFDPSTYVLRSNDIVSIDIQGVQPVVVRGLLVNIEGSIILPTVGSVKVSGLTIPEARLKIEERLNDYLKNPEVNLTLEVPRPINVTIVGPVPHPGKYVAPSQARVDVAISQSITSGNRDLTNPNQFSSKFSTNPNFSFRNIIIERTDGTRIRADLIGYYRTGDISKNPIVQNGDKIFIDRVFRETAKVSISGAVRTDLEMEYNPNDTPEALVNIAGGFETEADSTKLFVFRQQDGEIEKIELSRDQWADFDLRANDRLIVPFDRKPNSSASAWVWGEVDITGNFPIISGETTAEKLLEMAGGLTPEALPAATQLLRNGALENEVPNKFNAELMKRTSDQMLQGLEYLDAETKLSQNRVYIDLDNPEELSQIKIFDGDRLFVPRDENTVFVFGQVNQPGYYPYVSSYTVNDYISKAGGYALSADEERIFVLKAGNNSWYRPESTNLASGDRIFIDREPVEELNAKRSYEIQQSQLKNQRTQLIMTAITTITGIITTYVAIQNIRN